MDLIFANLSTLKTHLLTEALRAGTDYDEPIAALGKGVAGVFQKRCNRLFARLADDTFECSADRAHLVLPRYPVEVITKVEIRDSLALGWVDQGTVSDFILQLLEKSGLVTFPGIAGSCESQLRLTYTGGFFVETVEPSDDENYPSEVPAGATLLPPDLIYAWLLQCEYVWGQRDKLGLAVIDKATVPAAVAAIELLPLVERTLRDYARYSLT